MDLSRFDTRQKAQEGVDIPLEIDGEVIHGDDDLPIVFRTKGIADPEVHALIMKSTRNVSRTPKEAIEDDMRLARVAVTGWSENFSVDGEKVTYSRAAIDTVFANPVVRKAVLGRVFEEHRFMNGS